MAIEFLGRQVPTIDVKGAAEENISYEYPHGLDLEPGSQVHDGLVSMLLEYAHLGQDAMSNRYESWKAIDHTVTAYVHKDEKEQLVEKKDSRKPTAVVIPVTFAVKETLLTYLVSTFLTSNPLAYEGTTSEDTPGTALLRQVVYQQFLRSKMELALQIQWEDCLRYGLGAVYPTWEVETGNKLKYERGTFAFAGSGVARTLEVDKIWEGNQLYNIDPYYYFPDPKMPPHRMQDGEFVGWLSQDNRMNLLSQELEGNMGLFNCRYLKYTQTRSMLATDESGRGTRWGEPTERVGFQDMYSNPVDVLFMYVKLIPAEVGLGGSQYPEKWFFMLANDSVIIQATPSYLAHDKFPASVAAPLGDGRSSAPVSMLEMVSGLQKAIDWQITSRHANQRKSLHNMFVVDTYRLNLKDFIREGGGPGKLITTRRNAMGEGVRNAIEQLKVDDITQGNINDAMFLIDIVERVTGASGFLQGMLDQNAPERRTAAEYKDVKQNAASRLARLAKIIHTQSIRDIGHMLAAHTQQFISDEARIKLEGDLPIQLLELYGNRIVNGTISIQPEDLDVNYDIQPIDGSIPGDTNPDTLFRLYELASNDPALQAFNRRQMFKSLARRLGEKNIGDFEMHIVPDEQAMDFAAGPGVPMGGSNGAGRATAGAGSNGAGSV